MSGCSVNTSNVASAIRITFACRVNLLSMVALLSCLVGVRAASVLQAERPPFTPQETRDAA